MGKLCVSAVKIICLISLSTSTILLGAVGSDGFNTNTSEPSMPLQRFKFDIED